MLLHLGLLQCRTCGKNLFFHSCTTAVNFSYQPLKTVPQSGDITHQSKSDNPLPVPTRVDDKVNIVILKIYDITNIFVRKSLDNISLFQ